MGLVLILCGAKWGGPMSVLVARIVAVAFINIYGLAVGARLIKTHLLRLFVWRDLAWTMGLSVALSALARVLFFSLSWHPFWILAASFSGYTLVFFIVASQVKLISPDEYSRVLTLGQRGLNIAKRWNGGLPASCWKPHARVPKKS